MRSFKAFLGVMRSGAIQSDITWRAYAIEYMAERNHAAHVKKALRQLNAPRGSRVLALAHIAAQYEITGSGPMHPETIDLTSQLLAQWWVWSGIALGERKQGIFRKDVK